MNDTLTTLTLEGSSFVDVPRGKHRTSAKRAFVAANPHNLGRPTAIESEDLDNIARQLQIAALLDFERLARLKMFCRVYYFETQHTAKLLETFILEGTDRLQAASAVTRDCSTPKTPKHVQIEIRVRQTSENHRIFRALSSCQSHGAIRTQPRIRHRSNDRVDDDGQRDVRGTPTDMEKRGMAVARQGVDLLPSGVPERLTRDVPNVGTLCFDYTSNIRPPEDATAPSDEELHEILRAKSVLTPGRRHGGRKSSDALYAFARPPCACT